MKIAFRSVVTVLVALTLAASPAPGGRSTVNGFYHWYMNATRNGFWAPVFDGAKPYLEPTLYAGVDGALLRGERQGRPVFQYDPFNNAQQPSTSVSIGTAEGSATMQRVPVTLHFSGYPDTHIVVVVKHERSGWFIDDFDYGKDGKLRAYLKTVR